MGLFSFGKIFKKAKEEFSVKIQSEVLVDLKQRLSESGKTAVRLKVKGFG
jgi:hypothetical protein